jgi:ribosomal protein L37AE/L43A
MTVNLEITTIRVTHTPAQTYRCPECQVTWNAVELGENCWNCHLPCNPGRLTGGSSYADAYTPGGIP